MKKNLLLFYLNIIQKFKVIISLINEFLSIPTTPDCIINLLKIKIIQKIFLICTLITVFYSLRGIWLPFLVLIINHLDIKLGPLAPL